MRILRSQDVAGTAVSPQLIAPTKGRKWRETAKRLYRPAAIVAILCGAPGVAWIAWRGGWLPLLIAGLILGLALAAVITGVIVRFGRHQRQFFETLAKALDARDTYTAGHSTRVAEYSYATARALGLSDRASRRIRDAAELHDVGKIGIPDAVLQKTGPLTLEEVGLIRLHPLIGSKILKRAGHCRNLLPIVELHHENFDGSGYPYGLRGEEIPIGARIVRVADAFDAMTSRRCYRETPRFEWAVAELRRWSGIQFDPQIARVFLVLLENGVFDATLQSAAAQPWVSEWDGLMLSQFTTEVAAASHVTRGR